MANISDSLAAFTKDGDWPGLVQFANSVLETDPNSSESLFYLGMAKLRLGLPAEADSHLRVGLSVVPGDRWGTLLLVEALHATGQPKAAVEVLGAYLAREPDDEEVKELIVKALARAGSYAEACGWNARRTSIATGGHTARHAVVVQTFVKSDTLDMLFESLAQCSGTAGLDLFVIQDAVAGSQKFSSFGVQHSATAAVIGKWLPVLMGRFASVACYANAHNLGTTATCQKALDIVCRDHDGFLFFEDDCVLAKNAIDWMMCLLTTRVSPAGPMFVGGESFLFDSHGKSVEEALRQRITAISHLPEVRNAYSVVGNVPSTCFGTTAEIWRTVSGVRGLPLGDEDLNGFLLARGRRGVCLWPVVPRVKDVGMRHEFGYSVAHHGIARVAGKSTVLLSDAEMIVAEVVELKRVSPLIAEAVL